MRTRKVIDDSGAATVISILPNEVHDVYRMKVATGARWTFVSDPGLEVQRRFDINEYTDAHHDSRPFRTR